VRVRRDIESWAILLPKRWRIAGRWQLPCRQSLVTPSNFFCNLFFEIVGMHCCILSLSGVHDFNKKIIQFLCCENVREYLLQSLFKNNAKA
jgi:hypothetical protein